MTDKPKGGFEDWWASDGRFIDPDTSDVPWFDKRRELAGHAYEAALLAHHAALERELELKGLDIAFLAKFDALNTANEVNAKLQAELAEARAALPSCLGEWTGGSGGHRQYAGGCSKAGLWEVTPGGYVCGEHRSKNGDDDALYLPDHIDKLDAELKEAREALKAKHE